MAEERYWHWRNTQKPVRFFNLDARAGIFWLLLLLHFRKWTVALALLMSIIFWILERKGLTFPAALRALRAWFIGQNRPASFWYRRRGMIDNG